MTDETRYMISDAAKQVEVEAHVLRYWEEELELPIARTELGHRYYTEENIRIFQNIKELKERGFQLKAIKLLLPEIEKREIKNTDNIIHLEEKLNQKALEDALVKEHELENEDEATEGYEQVSYIQPLENKNAIKPEDPQKAEGTIKAEDPIKMEECESDIVKTTLSQLEVNVDKLVQFEKIVGDIVATALKENNKELNEQISESVAKEMDYVMRLKEEKEEERFRRLDETIRQHQNSKKYVAAAKSDDSREEKKGFFFWRR